MKLNKQIEKLTQTGPTITFPKYNLPFEHFTSDLREIISENFGFNVAKTLEYDDMEQAYYVRVTQSGPCRRSSSNQPVCIEVSEPVRISPRLDLLPQLEVLKSAIARVQKEYTKAAMAVRS